MGNVEQQQGRKAQNVQCTMHNQWSKEGKTRHWVNTEPLLCSLPQPSLTYMHLVPSLIQKITYLPYAFSKIRNMALKQENSNHSNLNYSKIGIWVLSSIKYPFESSR